MRVLKWLSALLAVVIIVTMAVVLYQHHLVPLWVTKTLIVLGALGVVAGCVIAVMAIMTLVMLAMFGIAVLSVFLDRGR